MRLADAVAAGQVAADVTGAPQKAATLPFPDVEARDCQLCFGVRSDNQ